MLESLITKVERYAGVTHDADNTLDQEMKEKYQPIGGQSAHIAEAKAEHEKKEHLEKPVTTEAQKETEKPKQAENQTEKKTEQKPAYVRPMN